MLFSSNESNQPVLVFLCSLFMKSKWHALALFCFQQGSTGAAKVFELRITSAKQRAVTAGLGEMGSPGSVMDCSYCEGPKS